jgi:hypothetical protein
LAKPEAPGDAKRPHGAAGQPYGGNRDSAVGSAAHFNGRAPDGTIVATPYGHWTQDEPPYILCVRFKIEELDAKALKALQ